MLDYRGSNLRDIFNIYKKLKYYNDDGLNNSEYISNTASILRTIINPFYQSNIIWYLLSRYSYHNTNTFCMYKLIIKHEQQA